MTKLKASPLVVIWDLLVLILVLFPLITGGVWFQRSGIKFELAQLSIPVLIVSILGFFVFKVFKKSPDQSKAIQSCLFIFEWWKNSLKLRPLLLLWITSAFVGAAYSFVALERHASLGSHAFDLGIFTNAIWNLVFRGEYISSVKDGMNLFADHQSPLFWIFGPIFYLFPRAETLLILQGFGLASGGVAAYAIGRTYKALKPEFLAVLPLLYWCYQPLRNANAFDFHPEVFMLPLFLWAIALLQGSRKKLILGFLFLILGAMAKESAGCVLTGIGLAWAFGAGPKETWGFTRKLGIFLIPLGFGVFYFDTQKVPQFFGQAYAYQNHFSQFGTSVNDVLLAPFTHPKLFWSSVFGVTRLKFLFWTLAPLGFLPLLGGRAFLAALPGYLILFLSAGDHRLNPIYHYAIEPSVGLFWAVPLGMIGVQKFLEKRYGDSDRRVTALLLVWVLFWASATFGRSEMYRIRKLERSPHSKWLVKEFLPRLNPLSSFAAPDALIPHLSTRPWIHLLPELTIPRRKSEIDGKSELVQCVILDRGVHSWGMSDPLERKLIHQLAIGHYEEVYQCGSLELYELTSKDAGLDHSLCLIEDPPCPQSQPESELEPKPNQ